MMQFIFTKNIIVFLFIIVELFFSSVVFAGESRAILDEKFNWLTQSDADRTLARIKQAGFNVYIPCVWHGRGAAWPTDLAPKEPLWEKKYKSNFDPLAYLITKAHQMGIEVHPWFTVVVNQNNAHPEYADKGTPEKAYNIHIPEFRKYIVKLIIDAVKKYDLDGVNLDYVRSMGICDSKYCIEDYWLKYNRHLLDDIKKMSKDRWGNAAQTISLWNGKAISEIVQNVSIEVKKIKPNIVISVDTVAGLREFELQGANGVEWANKGWVDVIYHMDYQPKNKKINTVFLDRGYQGLIDPDKLVLLVGNFSIQNNKAQPRSENTVAEVLRYSKGLRPDGNGVALYQYHFLTDYQVKKLSTGVFKQTTNTNWKINRQ